MPFSTILGYSTAILQLLLGVCDVTDEPKKL